MRFMRTALVVLGTIALVGCHESSNLVTAPPAADEEALLGGLLSGLVSCTPLPYDSVSQVVGPAGGVVTVGPHQLTIPAGALDSTVTITAAIVPGNVNAVSFGPQGLRFIKRVDLRLSYANCGPLAQLIPKRVAYTSDLLAILEIVPSLDDLGSATITGRLKHFSDYAVAW